MVDAQSDYTSGNPRGDAAPQPRDWRKGMSDNVALALLAYTALQIFVTVQALKKGLPAILPYVALAVLVVAIIPACRWFEKRWTDLSDDEAADLALKRAYRRDQMGLWALALGLPILLAVLFRLIFN